MLFYKVTADVERAVCFQDHRERQEYAFSSQQKGEMIYQQCDRNIFLFLSSVGDGRITAGVIVRGRELLSTALSQFWQAMGLQVGHCRVEEITLKAMRAMLAMAERGDYVADDGEVLEHFGLEELADRFRRGLYFCEHLLREEKGKAQLLRMSAEMLCEGTLSPEIERIFQGAARDCAWGHPVHYLVQSDRQKTRERMAEILLTALHQNDCIFSRRYCSVVESGSGLLQESALQALYDSCEGGAVVIDYSAEEEEEGEYARIGAGNIDRLCRAMQAHKDRVLTIFCLPRSRSRIKETFWHHLGNCTLVELNEEVVFENRAKAYLRERAKALGLAPDRRLYRAVNGSQKGFLADELNAAFDSWLDDHLKKVVYPQYSGRSSISQSVAKAKAKGGAYRELRQMVGLQEVKTVVEQALAYYKVQKLRPRGGERVERPSMHMAFLGNPGTAKTTVARLFASIMKDNGLLPRGTLHEVGRGDLVGKYVGWTAQVVRDAFQEAKGGVLFIDEAYSLLDDRDGLYGDEAINTIVQEMENHRSDTVVIFAGYPEKMEAFLQRNPGLRSRIAFHLPFADYTPEELWEIARQIAQKKGLQIAPAAREKLTSIFANAKEIADFGNGRFARNLVERAVISQSSRLMKMGLEQISPERLAVLEPEDFSPPPSVRARVKIGF